VARGPSQDWKRASIYSHSLSGRPRQTSVAAVARCEQNYGDWRLEDPRAATIALITAAALVFVVACSPSASNHLDDRPGEGKSAAAEAPTNTQDSSVQTSRTELTEASVATTSSSTSSTTSTTTTATSISQRLSEPVTQSDQLLTIDIELRLQTKYDPVPFSNYQETRDQISKTNPTLDSDIAICSAWVGFSNGYAPETGQGLGIESWIEVIGFAEATVAACGSFEVLLDTLDSFVSRSIAGFGLNTWLLYGCLGRNMIESVRPPSEFELRFREASMCSDVELWALDDVLQDAERSQQLCSSRSRLGDDDDPLTDGRQAEFEGFLSDTDNGWPLTAESQARVLEFLLTC
jgi:hypothetical protein